MFRTFLLLFSSILVTELALSQNTYGEITLPELMKKKKAGAEMVIIDVRTDGEYYDSSTNYKQGNIGRLKGIEHIPIQELQQNPEAIKSLEKYKDKDVYLICSHSYRSRAVSNLLLRNGFTHVTNVQGGMTEWFRRATELEPYKAEFYETKDVYKTIATGDLVTQLANKQEPILIGISNKPIFFYDTLTIEYYKYMPAFKNAINFSYADSLKLWEAVKGKSQPVILYNTVNSGAAELAEWLVNKGVQNVGLLVGNFNLFYEYIVNQQKTDQLKGYLKANSTIEFTTPELGC